MALDKIAAGEVANLNDFGQEHSNALVKTDIFEAFVMPVTPESPMPEHSVDSPVLVQCIEGHVRFIADGKPNDMRAGDWMHLTRGAMHACEAHEKSRLLVTIIFAQQEGQANRLDK